MFTRSLPLRVAMVITMSCLMFYSCSKDDGPSTPPAADCTKLTITLAETTKSSGCENTGVITATGAGLSDLTYKLDNGSFQASNVFNGVAAGDHTVTVKSGDCTKTANLKMTSDDPGPLFAEVKAMMAANCASCHSGANASGGKDWTVDCNIVANKDRIKARAVDGVPSFMPQGGELTQENKDKITAWIAGGGKFTD